MEENNQEMKVVCKTKKLDSLKTFGGTRSEAEVTRQKRQAEERQAIYAKNRIRGIEDTLFSIKQVMNSDDFKPRTMEHHAMVRLVQMTEERLEEYKQTWEAYADKYDLEKGII